MQLLKRSSGHPKLTTKFDHWKALSPTRLPPLSSQRVRGGPTDPKERSGFFDSEVLGAIRVRDLHRDARRRYDTSLYWLVSVYKQVRR